MASPAFGGQYLLMTQTRNPVAPSWHNCFSHSSHSRPCSARSVQRSADCNFARANTQSQLPPSPAKSTGYHRMSHGSSAVHLGPTSAIKKLEISLEFFQVHKVGNQSHAWEILHFDDLPSLAEPSFTDGCPIFSQLYPSIFHHFSGDFPAFCPDPPGFRPTFASAKSWDSASLVPSS